MARPVTQEPQPPQSEQKKGKARRKKQKTAKASYAVSLAEIIGASILSPPVKLFRKYKGKMMEATLLPDGGVEFQKTRYNTCSTAAETARSTITGRRMNTNGWSFWQYTGAGDKTLTLADARNQFLAGKPSPPSGVT